MRSFSFGEYCAGFAHVFTVLISKGVEHHFFFGADAQGVEENEHEQVGEAGDPVVQQQRLGNDPDPLGCIHWVADVAEDAVCDEFVLFAYLKCRRPV